MTKNLERAMVAASEYRRTAEREGSNHAKCIELRDDIAGLVGHWTDGRLVIPDAVRAEMGLLMAVKG